MPRTYLTKEVEILGFFEEAPIEKADLLFNIVKEKMQGRLSGSGRSEPKKKQHSAPKETGERRSGEDGDSSQQI